MIISPLSSFCRRLLSVLMQFHCTVVYYSCATNLFSFQKEILTVTCAGKGLRMTIQLLMHPKKLKNLLRGTVLLFLIDNVLFKYQPISVFVYHRCHQSLRYLIHDIQVLYYWYFLHNMYIVVNSDHKSSVDTVSDI